MARFRSLLLSLCICAGATLAQEPGTYYETNCASCHSIGGGYLAGPDLKGATARADRKWLIDFMRNPESKAKEPYAAKMIAEAGGMVMPAYPDLTDDAGDRLLTYIEDKAKELQPAVASLAVDFSSSDVATGRQIFVGAVTLERRGAACVACHQAAGLPTRGGKLGPDLSRAYDKFGQARGLSAWLKSPPTPVMKSIYHDKQMNDAEIHSLVAFFHETQETAEQFGEAPVRAVQFGGIAASLVGALVIGFVWRDRSRGARRKLFGKRGAK